MRPASQSGLYQSGAHSTLTAPAHEGLDPDAGLVPDPMFIQQIIVAAREDARREHEAKAPPMPPLDQVVKHWAFQWILRGGLALLIAIAGYAFQQTMESIEHSLQAVEKTTTDIQGTISRIDERVNDLEETRTIHRVYIDALHKWRDEMKTWRSGMDRHEHSRQGTVKEQP